MDIKEIGYEGVDWIHMADSYKHDNEPSSSIRVKVKVKLSLCLTKHHAMKAYWGSGGISSRILDFGTRWR